MGRPATPATSATSATSATRTGRGGAAIPSRRGLVCALIATHNGEGQIAPTVEGAARQCPVFVVSDGSTDGTAGVARRAGAAVLKLTDNVGKPAALARALAHFRLEDRYEAVAVIDDDTTLAPNFVHECLKRMTAGVAIVVGKTMSDWRRSVRWNPWVAGRAFSYWKFQLFIRRGQSALNVMNCISGSNSVYRTSLLRRLTEAPIPYIVDDTYWTLETHRRKLGRIVYAPRATAWVQDPTTLREWYRQNLRWMWGTMQGIAGHRVGRRLTRFDIAYVGLILDWVLYVALWPLLLVFGFLASGQDPLRFLVLYFAGYLLWGTVGAIALRKWRLVVLVPALMIMDWIQRVNFVHAFVLTVRRPRVESCRWESPTRYSNSPAGAAATAASV